MIPLKIHTMLSMLSVAMIPVLSEIEIPEMSPYFKGCVLTFSLACIWRMWRTIDRKDKEIEEKRKLIMEKDKQLENQSEYIKKMLDTINSRPCQKD